MIEIEGKQRDDERKNFFECAMKRGGEEEILLLSFPLSSSHLTHASAHVTQRGRMRVER